MQCPACLQSPPEGARFCPACGGTLPGAGESAPDALEGKIVGGRYVVRQLLAEGGMGRVYVADQQMGTTVRKVALKVMLADYALNPKVVTRFLRECGMVCELEHPNTIKFYDYGRTEDGDLFIAMEFVPGESLAAAIKRQGPISPERVDRIFSQICGSLQEAHDKGIVHRDIKPENIMLTQPAGEPDVVKVLDFGIARRDGDRDPRLTPLGLVLGSPPFMSPEQFRGADVDARSDIYSVGVVAFKALTGVLPFKAHELFEWATLHMSAPPVPFDGTPGGPAVPASMRAAVLRALAKSPDDRPQSMRELYQELTIGAGGRTSLLGRSQPPPAFSSTPPPPAPPSESLAPTQVKRSSYRPPTFADVAPPAGPLFERPPRDATEVKPPPAPPSESLPTEAKRSSYRPPTFADVAPRAGPFFERPPPTVREPIPPTVRQGEAKSNTLAILASVALVALAIFGGVLLAKRLVDGPSGAPPPPPPGGPPPGGPPPPPPARPPGGTPPPPLPPGAGAATSSPTAPAGDGSCRRTMQAAAAGQCAAALGFRARCPASDPEHAAAHAAYGRYCGSGAP